MQSLKSKVSTERDEDTTDLGVILVRVYNKVKKSLDVCISILAVAQSISGVECDLTPILEKLRERQQALEAASVPIPMKKDTSREAEYEAHARESCFDSVEEVADFK